MIFSQVLAWFADPAYWRGPDGVGVRIAEHLFYTLVAVLLASVIAVPVGLLVGHTARGEVVLVGLANAMRALPTLGLLTFLFLLVRSQAVSTLVVLVVLAVPPVLAGGYAGVRSAVLHVVVTTTVAAYVGLGGLGRFLLDGLNSADYPQMVAGALVVAVLAVLLDLLLAGIARLVVPVGVRLASSGGSEDRTW